MWIAIWLLCAGFAGMMWGVMLTSINSTVTWADAVGAVATAFAAVGTVGTLAFAVWQNYLNRRELLLQKLNLDAAELKAVRSLMTDVCAEAMRCGSSLYFSRTLETWTISTDPEKVAALKDRVSKAHDQTVLPLVRGMCDRARSCLDNLASAHALSPYLPRPDALRSIQEYLAAAKQVSAAELTRADELQKALIRQLKDLGELDAHL